MRTNIVAYPIVGSSFRKPADTILSILAAGTKLVLRQEPEHEVTHKNAIAVWISSEELFNLNAKQLTIALEKAGFDLEKLLSVPEFKLGYIPAPIAEKLDIGTEDIPAELNFDFNGKIRVGATIPVQK